MWVPLRRRGGPRSGHDCWSDAEPIIVSIDALLDSTVQFRRPCAAPGVCAGRLERRHPAAPYGAIGPRLDRSPSRADRVDDRHRLIAAGPSRHRSGRCGDLADDGRMANELVDTSRPRGRSHRDGLDDVLRRHRADRRHRRFPSVAPPVHVPRQRRRAGVIGQLLINGFRRPRPYDVTIIGRWQGYSLPSATVAIVSFTVVGLIYMLVGAGLLAMSPSGSGSPLWRSSLRRRMYLGVDHPFDVLVGAALGVAIPLIGSASSRRTRSSRSPTTRARRPTSTSAAVGARPSASRPGAARPDGPRHQAGRPRRLRRIDAAAAPRRGRPRHVPVRQALRDEPRPRRPLVQAGTHHLVRPLRGRDAVPIGPPPRPVRGLRAPRHARRGDADRRAAGIVQLTPEREYLFVTEFFDGAVEIGEAEVDDRSSTKAWRWSADCGTTGSPTATSSRPT